MLLVVRHIYDNTDKIVSILHAAVPPVPFHFLGLVTGSSKTIHDFQHGFAESLRRHIATVIELQWEQHLESPPLVAHKLPFPGH
jgi:hypothetical protein